MLTPQMLRALVDCHSIIQTKSTAHQKFDPEVKLSCSTAHHFLNPNLQGYASTHALGQFSTTWTCTQGQPTNNTTVPHTTLAITTLPPAYHV